MQNFGIRFIQFDQTTPSSLWVIDHNFGMKPLVEVMAYLNGKLEKAFPLAITHNNDNQTVISWSSPRTGSASLAINQL